MAKRRLQWDERKLMWYKKTAKGDPNYRVHKAKLKEELENWNSENSKDTASTRLFKILTLSRYDKITERQTVVKYLPHLIADGSEDQEAIQDALNSIFAELVGFLNELGEIEEITRLTERWIQLQWTDYELQNRISESRDLRLLQGLVRRSKSSQQVSLFPSEDEE